MRHMQQMRRLLLAFVAAVLLSAGVAYAGDCEQIRDSRIAFAITMYDDCKAHRDWWDWMYSWYNDECYNVYESRINYAMSDYQTCLQSQDAGGGSSPCPTCGE